MGKYVMLIGVVLVLFGSMERNFISFSTGLSVIVFTVVGELAPKRFRITFSRLKYFLQIRSLMSSLNRNKEEIEQSEEWFKRFALRFETLVNSYFLLNTDGNIRYQVTEQDREDGELLFLQFKDFLSLKGVRIPDLLLRLLLNDRVIKHRLHQFTIVLSTIVEEKLKIEDLLKIFVEEMEIGRGEVCKSFWNNHTLIRYIETNYSHYEIIKVFPKWQSRKEQELSKKLKEITEDVRYLNKLRQLEEWLLSGSNLNDYNLSHFDEMIHEPEEFRIHIGRFLQQKGYRVTEAGEELADFLIERSGVRLGVLLKPLGEGEFVPPQGIYEAYATYSLENAQGAMVITNQYFSPEAVPLANKLGVILVNRDQLQTWINRYSNPYSNLSKQG